MTKILNLKWILGYRLANIIKHIEVRTLCTSIIDYVDWNTCQVHFGSTYANYTSTDKVYLFAQCTPDIDSFSCKKCLKTGLADIYAYYNMSKGVTTFYPSCQLGYDTVLSLLLYLLPPPASPKSTSVPG